jgi:hypothetical protein
MKARRVIRNTPHDDEIVGHAIVQTWWPGEYYRITTCSMLECDTFERALRNAEAIAIGEGVPVPVRLCFDDLPEDARPLSGTARFSVAWVKEIDDPAFLGSIVERWRQEGG